MKWNEMSPVQKILFVTGLICCIAYTVLTALELFEVLILPAVVGPALFGVFWLCEAVIQKSKKNAIWYYVIAAAWFLIGLLQIVA